MDAWALNEAYAGMPLPKVRAEPTPQHMIPITIMVARTIQRCESGRLLKKLFDSGGSHTLIHERALPLNASAVRSDKGKRQLQTIAGTFTTHQEVELREIFCLNLTRQNR
eukprot:15363344-Ditylum_brightwellii.AAC.1